MSASKTRQAQELLEQLRGTYLNELPSRFDDIEAVILRLQTDENFQDNFEELYRNVHSMKGTAGTYGLPIYTNICHQLEDLLNSERATEETVRAEGIEQFLSYIDLMREAHEVLISPQCRLSDIEDKLAHLGKDRIETGKALLVENSRATRQICSQVLESQGFFVVVTGDGKTALERLLHEKFDVLVCGLEIPELNGKALIAAVRLSGKLNADIRAALITTKKTETLEGAAPNTVLSRDQHLAGKLTAFVQPVK